MGIPRNLRFIAAGAAAGALALGSVGTASANVPLDPLLGGTTNAVGGLLHTLVPGITAPLVGDGGLLDGTNVVVNANANVPGVAHVQTTDTTVAIDDGKIFVATDTQANVLNVVKTDTQAAVTVDTNRPGVIIHGVSSENNVAGIKANVYMDETTVDLKKLTVDAPKTVVFVKAGDLKVKAKAKAHANLKSGKVFVKAKAKVKAGHHTVLKAKAKVKVKIRPNLKIKAKVFVR